tara:strand:+ start:259 stop:465 length:207 start_codon:yes stop_codon:yes gene_type:complete
MAKTYDLNTGKETRSIPERQKDKKLLAKYTPEDKKNVINYHKKIKKDPNYIMKDYERESILRQYGKNI